MIYLAIFIIYMEMSAPDNYLCIDENIEALPEMCHAEFNRENVVINEGIPECEDPNHLYIVFTPKGCMSESEWLAMRKDVMGITE